MGLPRLAPPCRYLLCREFPGGHLVILGSASGPWESGFWPRAGVPSLTQLTSSLFSSCHCSPEDTQMSPDCGARQAASVLSPDHAHPPRQISPQCGLQVLRDCGHGPGPSVPRRTRCVAIAPWSVTAREGKDQVLHRPFPGVRPCVALGTRLMSTESRLMRPGREACSPSNRSARRVPRTCSYRGCHSGNDLQSLGN